ncbi:MAG TPA: ATP-binding protein [Thermoanaerobaculia bacterium]|nr:ATP-binding protein [Thermoanaerobaculia bacterium]
MSDQQLGLFPDSSPTDLLLLTPADIYEAASEKLLLLLSEDRRLERKPASITPRALGDYLCMWANTPSGGLIVAGQENDGTFSGCSRLTSDRRNNLERSGDIYCPDARLECKRVPVSLQDGSRDFVTLFRVHYRQDRLVRTSNGAAFIRSGESKKKLTADEERHHEADRRQVTHEQEPALYAFPEDFSIEYLEQFSAAFHETRRFPSGQCTLKDVLQLRRLGEPSRDGFRPNMACALIFANDPGKHYPGAKIRFLRFEGEVEGTGARFNATKDITIEGPIPYQIVEAEKIVEQQLREFARLGPDGKFFVSPEYPKAAWYEAVVNACVHRSYMLRNMNIFIKMFDDRLEIESPGGFPPGVTAENIYRSHNPRNPHLMSAMYYLRFVKCAHEGTRRIRESMEAMSLPTPEFRQTTRDFGQVVRVILRNNIKQRRVWIDADAASLIGETIFATLTQDQRRAINYVAENGEIGVTDLQRLTGRTWTTAKRTLEKLVAMNLLIHVKKRNLDRDPKARYILRPKPSGGLALTE